MLYCLTIGLNILSLYYRDQMLGGPSVVGVEFVGPNFTMLVLVSTRSRTNMLQKVKQPKKWVHTTVTNDFKNLMVQSRK
jgi:hypothetical protein